MCQVRPGMPERVGQVVARALAKEVQERPTAADLGRSLREKQVAQGVTASPLGLINIPLAQEHFELGVRFKWQEKWTQAIEELEQAIEIWPGYVEAHYELGEVFSAMKEFERAQEAYQQAVALDPGFARACIRLAESYKQQGASTRAATALQEAIQADANSVRSHYYLVMRPRLVLGDRDSYLEILSAYQRTVTINPNSAEIHYNLGRVLAQGFNFEQAITEYQQATSLRPSYPEAFVAMGNAYLDLNRPEHALPAFQRATGMEWPEEKPFSTLTGALNRSDAYLGLARAHIKLGQFDQANAMAQLAVEMCSSVADPHPILDELAHAYEDQGQVYREQNRFDLAAAAFLQAVHIYSVIQDNARCALAYFWVATSYCILGLQSLNQGARDEAAHLLNNALEAWEAGYSIRPKDGSTETEKVWGDIRSLIESARRKAKSRWRLW